MEHTPWKIFAILLACAMFVVMAVFNALAGEVGQKLGIFLNSTGEISDVFYLEITPAGWTFAIWAFIYTWQILLLVYGLSTICRSTGDTYIYQLSLTPPAIYFVYVINNMCNVGWLFAWDRQRINVALALLALTPFTLYICLFLSFRGLYGILGESSKLGIRKDIWLVRFLIQNGMAFYATWVTIATLLNLAMVLTYNSGPMSQRDASTVALSILAFEVILWFVLDTFVFDKYVRYTFSPYIVLVVAFAGVVARNFDLDNTYRNSVFSLIHLILTSVLLASKFVLMIWRHFKRPILRNFEYEIPN